MIPASATVAALIGRLGRFRWAIWGGWILTIVSTGCLLILDADTKVPVWAAVLVILGLGHGFILSSLNLAVQAIATVENAAHAVTMYSFLRSVGAALGVGISGSIFQNFMADKLEAFNLPTNIAENAEGFIGILHGMPDDNPSKRPIIDSYTRGIHGVFIVMTGLGGLALLLTFLIGRHSMDKLNKSEHVLAKRADGDASDSDDTAVSTPVGHSDTENNFPLKTISDVESGSLDIRFPETDIGIGITGPDRRVYLPPHGTGNLSRI